MSEHRNNTNSTDGTLKHVVGQYETELKLNGWEAFSTEVCRIYRDFMRRFMPEEEYTDFMNDMYAKYHK